MPRDDDNYRRRSTSDDDGRRGGRDARDDDRPARRTSSRDDDDRPARRSSRDEEDDRGSRRGGRSSGFTYERRDDADAARRAQGSSKFDKYLNPDIKLFKPREGGNIIRILPPTWKGAKHYGYDAHVHFGVGADSQTYLDLSKMKDDANAYFKRANLEDRNGKLVQTDGTDPVEEYAAELQRDGLEKEAKQAKRKLRVGVYLIDRKDERSGVQFWLMAEGNDREIVQQSINARTGAALAIDDPEDGFDISFERRGTGLKTEYSGFKVDRDSSALGDDRWLQFAVDHPIPEQLIFYPYDHIKTALGGGGTHSSRHDRDRDDDRPARSSREDSDRGRATRDREDEPARGRGRSSTPDVPTWEDVHDMSRRELEDLIDVERLDIQPKEARDDKDLADWVCEEMKLQPKPAERRSVRDDPEDERGDKLRRMRESRDRD